MKVGRNQPCICGSGKKYKKCCLGKVVTPPEVLHYRRISEVHDKLMPRLIDHGISVFGEMALNMAFAEFMTWPDPEDAPDEEAIERANHLFWPWFVFNWEYDRLDDEEELLNGPEEVTITDLFIQNKKIDSTSLEGKLLFAANRTPYSFHEILSTDIGHTVTIQDVLTGNQMVVQERLGSEYMKTGDLIFSRAVQVDNIGMFLGLSTFVLPPRMKPEMIQARREISRGGSLSHDDLYEWDLEIRAVFWDMDRRLHTMPEMVNTDGDPMEFHKLIYDIDAPELAVKKLAALCHTESLEEILGAAHKSKDGDIVGAAFCWSRKSNRVNKGLPNTILGNIEIEGTRITVSVNSANRAQTIRGEIDRRMGNAAHFRFDEISNKDAILNKERKEDDTLPTQDELMAYPEVQHQIEQMLRAHWEDWVGQPIPLLGDKTPQQAVKTADGRESVEALLLDAEKLAAKDPVRASVEKEFIADVRRRLKLDKHSVKKRSTIDPNLLAERIIQVKSKISVFGSERLHDTYTNYSLQLCDAIAASRDLNLHRGRIEIWTAAIVYAIARLNWLFDPETPNYLTTDELCAWFQVKKTTVSNKASTILSSLEIYPDDDSFCAPHITRLFQFFEDEHGLIHPITALESEEEQSFEPIPLKSSSWQKKSP